MRQEVLKQKQLIAYKNIQPLARLANIKGEYPSGTTAIASMGKIEALLRKTSEDDCLNSQNSALYHTADIEGDGRDGRGKL